MNKKFSIYNYDDYRIALKEYYAWRKKENPKFSYRVFAQKAQISASIFPDLVKGRMKMTQGICDRYSLAMKLDPQQKEYFSHMYKFTLAPDEASRKPHFESMKMLKPLKAKKFEKGHEKYVSGLHNILTRHAIAIMNISDNHEEISKCCNFPVAPEKIKEAIKLLESLEMIRKNEKGIWKPLDDNLSAKGSELAKESIVFHKKGMIDLGRSALDLETAFKSITCSTFALSREKFAEAKRRIEILRQEIMDMSHDEKNPDQVYQLNVQFFPIVERPNHASLDENQLREKVSLRSSHS